MRSILAALLAMTLLVLLVPVARATGCTTQDSPCPLLIDVGDGGFLDGSTTDFAQGDWYEIDFSNSSDVHNHTITLDGYGLSVALGIGTSDSQTKTVQFTQAGCFAMKDQPSGATRNFRVFVGDPIDFQQGKSTEKDPCAAGVAGTSGKAKTPGFEMPLLVAAIALAMLIRRRL